MYGTFWALIPPVVAIVLALITKEVYSSLFVGIVVGALFVAGFNPVSALDTMVNDGFIASMADGKYVMDLVLRNNITTEEHPMGVYHPHSEYHHIKKENIGLIEVMGLAVLPARLVEELDAVADALINNKPMDTPETASHKEWAETVKASHPEMNEGNVMDILREEVGKVFVGVLEHAGVYKRDDRGKAAFDKFMEVIQ